MICCISHNSDPYTIYYNCGIEDHKTKSNIYYDNFNKLIVHNHKYLRL